VVALMQAHAAETAALLGPELALIELGSGSGRKTRLLLDHLERPAAYVPVDIAPAQLLASAARLGQSYPGLRVYPVCADFCAAFALPPIGRALRSAVYFPGSTIGNLEPGPLAELLHRLRQLVGTGGALLVGVDTKKDPAVLERAYDDAAGVTAAFNLNLLTRINRELGGSFDSGAFAHRAFYDARAGRIEMHLVSRRDQIVRVAGQSFAFRAGETIHTENSYKYAPEEFVQLARATGWAPARLWQDAERRFSVLYLVA
jgi:L-histidine Nalpha-methyltransferase